MSIEEKATNVESTYRIGAVSKITGVPADTLRVWERRYGVVEPRRSQGGNRIYNEADLIRLELIKRLVDHGHAIGTVARLGTEQLQDRLATLREARVAEPPVNGAEPPALRIALVGPTLALRFNAQAEASAQIDLIITATDLEAIQTSGDISSVDTLVVELATLQPNSRRQVNALRQTCGADTAVVVYGFGSSDLVADLERHGVLTQQQPLGWDELERTLDAIRRRHPLPIVDYEMESRGIPPRRFTDQELARLSSYSTAVQCECPKHLTDLVITLTRFEAYSEQCEHRNTRDAALHAYLHQTTARARSAMEAAIARLAAEEGFELGPAPETEVSPSPEN